MAKSADAFRTISEVAEWLDTPAHVLRFWESKFSQVKPVKRAGGRRYYRPTDMKLLGGIKQLLHADGLTIKGVQKILREQGVKHVAGLSQPLDEVTEAEATAATIEVPMAEEAAPTTADVVNLRPTDTPAPAPADKVTSAADTTAQAAAEDSAKAEEEAAAKAKAEENIKAAADAQLRAESQPQEDAAPEAAAEAETPETVSPEIVTSTDAPAPAMPSFLQRKAPVDTPASDNLPAGDAETANDAPPAAKRPDTPDVPADPSDDITAEPGPLTALAQLRKPVSAEALKHLNTMAAELAPGSSPTNS